MASEPHLGSLLQALGASGGLGHLTLIRNHAGLFQASHRAPGAAGYRVEHDADPARSLIKALGVYDAEKSAVTSAVPASTVLEDGEDLI